MTINQFINNFTISKAVKHSKPEHYNGKKYAFHCSASGDVDLPIMPFTSSSDRSRVCPQNTYSACYPPPSRTNPHYSKQL